MTRGAYLNFPTGPVCSSVSQRNESKERCKVNAVAFPCKLKLGGSLSPPAFVVNKLCGNIPDTHTHKTCHGINTPFHPLPLTYPSMVSYLSL